MFSGFRVKPNFKLADTVLVKVGSGFWLPASKFGVTVLKPKVFQVFKKKIA